MRGSPNLTTGSVRGGSPCVSPPIETYGGFVGDYDFSATPFAERLGVDTLIFSFLLEDRRFFFYEPSESRSYLLCLKADGTLGVSYSNEIKLAFKGETGDGPVRMVMSWDGTTSEAARMK